MTPGTTDGAGPGTAVPDRSAVLAALSRLDPVFQPVVELDTGAVIGFEALLRGPRGPLHTPGALFAAAAAHSLTARLDWAARRAAGLTARAAGMGPDLELFLNSEPVALDHPITADVENQAALFDGMSVTVEFTERDMAAHLPGMLRTAEWIRSRGWRVAVDDVGVDPSSLALLPLIRPEVIKLDLRLVQSNTTVEIAEIVTAANAEAERTGARILAEGIETATHAELAEAMGATLGQGWRFGRPGRLPPLAGRHGRAAPAPRRAPPAPAAPGPGPRPLFDLVAGSPLVRRTTRPLLAAISEQLWGQAEAIGQPAVVLCSFGNAAVPQELVARYSRLARRCTYVALVAADAPVHPGPDLRTAALAPGDPAHQERHLVVLGPHFAGALLSRSVPATDPARFEYVVTYDRTTVLDAARELVDRLVS